MANLLPTIRRKDLTREYRFRLASAVLFLLAILFGISIALLVPAYILSNNKEDLAEEKLAAAKAGEEIESEMKAYAEIIDEVNRKIAVLSEESGSSARSPEVLVDAVLSRRGNSIQVETVRYEFSSGETKISLAGVASDRDSLWKFKSDLEQETVFSEVTLPISSFVSKENIHFSIVARIAALKTP